MRYVFSASGVELILRGHVVRIRGYGEPLTVVDKRNGYVLVLSNGRVVQGWDKVELVPPTDPEVAVVQPDPKAWYYAVAGLSEGVQYEYRWVP